MIFKRVKKISVQTLRLIKSQVFIIKSLASKTSFSFQKASPIKKNNYTKSRTFGKVGLFLIFAMLVMNVSIGINIETKNINKQIVVSLNTVSANAVMDIFWNTPKAYWGNKASGAVEKIGDATSKAFVLSIKVILSGVLTAVHLLVLMAALMFDKAIDQELFNAIIGNNLAVYKGWAAVRDFLNLFFMLALLFSAFATVFQVQKYHLKKIIILLVVMALLVNFSYPVTLFVIDFSNSAMYYLVDLIPAAPGASQSALIAKMANMGMLTKTIDESVTISTILFSIIFQFILFISIFAYAINLLIRILAFAVLLIFAPAGFALMFFPSTSNIANSWWNNLIKYAVMGPLMIFFLLLANLMFVDTVNSVSHDNDEASLIAIAVMFTIPIVFLWMGLIASQKFGGEASASAMSIAKKTGNKIKGYGQKMSMGAAKGAYHATGASGVVEGVKQGYNAKFVKSTKRRNENIAAKVASGFGDKDASAGLERKRWEDNKKKYANYESSALKSNLKGGDLAAADVLMDRKQLTPEEYSGVMTANTKNDTKSTKLRKLLKFAGVNDAKSAKLRKLLNFTEVNDAKRREDLTNKFKSLNNEKRLDVVASVNARESIDSDDGQRDIARVMVNNSGMNKTEARGIVIKDNVKNTFKNLNKDTFIKQDWNKMADEITRKLRRGTDDEKAEARATRLAISESFNNMTDEAKAEIRKNMSQGQVEGLAEHGLEVRV